MKRMPIVATVIVALACAIMVALGVWQLQRASWKEGMIARYAENRTRPAEVMLPPMPPIPDAALFRRTRALCVTVTGWQVRNGMAASGQRGFRHIAACSTGVEGPGFLADMGISARPDTRVAWAGGEVAGIISLDPDEPTALSRLFRTPPPPRAMIVAAQPAPGLTASLPPSTDAIPNNHRSYAFQWFSFAGFAALIFGLALVRRARRQPRD